MSWSTTFQDEKMYKNILGNEQYELPTTAANKAIVNLINGYLFAANSTSSINLSKEWSNILKNLANYFEANAAIIAKMVYYSGKDFNNLKKFSDCIEDHDTRYIAFSLSGLPIGIFLGICGPVQCMQNDYN